jgi:aspartyl/asparaginyl-tRNA synthetase
VTASYAASLFAALQFFKGYLLSQGFQEIHTPKLIAGASGAQPFLAWL